MKFLAMSRKLEQNYLAWPPYPMEMAIWSLQHRLSMLLFLNAYLISRSENIA